MAAAAMEMEVMVWFTMDGTNQLKKGAAEKVKLDPTSDVTLKLKTMLEQAMDAERCLRDTGMAEADVRARVQMAYQVSG